MLKDKSTRNETGIINSITAAANTMITMNITAMNDMYYVCSSYSTSEESMNKS